LIVTVADTDLLGSAQLVAVIVAVCCEVTFAGDVYTPVVLIPPGPVRYQEAPWFELPVIVAVNCWIDEGFMVTLAGEMLIVTGTNVTVAVPDRLPSCTLVALTVTVLCDAIDAGAVYSPELLTLPTDGLIDHVTAVLLASVTVAENCCVPEMFSMTLPGDTLTLR
jgi:hypothetical protein